MSNETIFGHQTNQLKILNETLRQLTKEIQRLADLKEREVLSQR